MKKPNTVVPILGQETADPSTGTHGAVEVKLDGHCYRVDVKVRSGGAEEHTRSTVPSSSDRRAASVALRNGSLRQGEGAARFRGRPARRGGPSSGCYTIGALAIVPLLGGDPEAHLLFERATEEAAAGMGLPARSLAKFGKRCAGRALEQGEES